jgi:ABC-type phosphate/phosphonate transport system substrate-binding protein
MRPLLMSMLIVLPCSLWTMASLLAEEKVFTLIVMDPLAAPLSCPCVEGYAQRKYEALQAHLKQSLRREVQLVFAQALSTALKETGSKADLIIGKDSVVRADAAAAKIEVIALSQLTDKMGSTKQHGLIVVNKADPAQVAKDLNGYTIIFGPSEAAEKHSAALQLLKDANVTIPKTLHIDEACSDGACKVIDLGPKSKTAAVISSYAQPLLEGCGTIKKGDLRVVGQTEAVPFITAFVNSSLSEADQNNINDALLSVKENPELLDALESLVGFLPYDDSAVAKKK